MNTDFLIFDYLDDVDLEQLFSIYKFSSLDMYYLHRVKIQYKMDPHLKPEDMTYKEYYDVMKYLFLEYKYEIPEFAKNFNLLKVANKLYGFEPTMTQFNIIVAHSNLAMVKKVIDYFKISKFRQEDDDDGYNYNKYYNTYDTAVYFNQLEIVRFLTEKYGLAPTENGIEKASEKGNLEVLKYIYSKFGFLPKMSKCDLNIFKWLLQIAFNTLDEKENLAKLKQLKILFDMIGFLHLKLEVMTYLAQNHIFPMSKEILEDAYINQEDFVNQFAFVPQTSTLKLALRENKIYLLPKLCQDYKLDLINDNKYLFNDKLSPKDNFEAFTYMCENNYLIPTKEDMHIICHYGHIRLANYLFEKYGFMPAQGTILDIFTDLDRWYDFRPPRKNKNELMLWLIHINYVFEDPQKIFNYFILEGNLNVCQKLKDYLKIDPQLSYIELCFSRGNFPVWNWLKSLYPL